MAIDQRMVLAARSWDPPGPAPREQLAYISPEEAEMIDTGAPGPTFQVAGGRAVSGEGIGSYAWDEGDWEDYDQAVRMGRVTPEQEDYVAKYPRPGIGSMAQSDIQPNNQLIRFRGNARGMGWDVPSYAADRGGGTGAAGATSGPPGNPNPSRSGGGSGSGGGASGGGSGAGQQSYAQRQYAANNQGQITNYSAAPPRQAQPGVHSNTKRAEVGYGSGGGMPGPGGSFDRAGAYSGGRGGGPQTGGQQPRQQEMYSPRFNHRYPKPTFQPGWTSMLNPGTSYLQTFKGMMEPLDPMPEQMRPPSTINPHADEGIPVGRNEMNIYTGRPSIRGSGFGR